MAKNSQVLGPARRLWRNGLSAVPLVGEIGGRLLMPPAVIDDPRFGASTRNPFALEIRVAHDPQAPLHVGRLVKQRLFADGEYADKEFIFNVCFSCARSVPLLPGRYADPRSIWFNVFFGYYEVDVPAASWQRPFGYRPDRGGWRVDHEELGRLAKADWNYFSNYLYGVPLSAIAGCDFPILSGATVADVTQRTIAGRVYDCGAIDGAQVVSAYSTGRRGQRLQVNEHFTPLWWFAFGQPCPRRPEHPQSFFPVRMKMRYLMRWDRVVDDDLGVDAYRTFIYGGTINKGFPDVAKNEEFLTLQLDAVEDVIHRRG